MWHVGIVSISYCFCCRFVFFNDIQNDICINDAQTITTDNIHSVFQGTGLEVLIFCAFSATFFLAACSVSLCRRPRDILVAPPPSGVHAAIEHVPRIEQPQHVLPNQV